MMMMCSLAGGVECVETMVQVVMKAIPVLCLVCVVLRLAGHWPDIFPVWVVLVAPALFGLCLAFAYQGWLAGQRREVHRILPTVVHAVYCT